MDTAHTSGDAEPPRSQAILPDYAIHQNDPVRTSEQYILTSQGLPKWRCLMPASDQLPKKAQKANARPMASA